MAKVLLAGVISRRALCEHAPQIVPNGVSELGEYQKHKSTAKSGRMPIHGCEGCQPLVSYQCRRSRPACQRRVKFLTHYWSDHIRLNFEGVSVVSTRTYSGSAWPRKIRIWVWVRVTCIMRAESACREMCMNRAIGVGECEYRAARCGVFVGIWCVCVGI